MTKDDPYLSIIDYFDRI